MRTLVVEDDFVSRTLLQRLLAPWGEAHVAVDGQEAVEAFGLAVEEGRPYDLVCLDIIMPKMDGQAVLKAIRAIEDREGVLLGRGVKIVMTTMLDDSGNVMGAFREQCDGYLVKPVTKQKLTDQLHTLGMVAESVL